MMSLIKRILAGGLAVSLLLAACGERGEPLPQPVPPSYPPVAAAGPPCEIDYSVPFHDPTIACIEFVYDDVLPPEAAPGLMGLAFAPDGTLYVVRTALGEIWALRDADGDQFMDAPERVAAGLYLPTHLTVHEGALIVVSVGGLVRLEPDGAGGFAEPQTLVADLGGDPRLWPGAVHVGAGPQLADQRIYVGLGGELASFALDGSDRRVEATGLRYVTDFAWHPVTGDLWLLDSRGSAAAYDAVVRVPADAAEPPDFSDLTCAGASSAAQTCLPDAITFDDQSAPVGLAFYQGTEWPFWTGDLLVALGGSWNRAEPSGYALVVVDFDDAGNPVDGVELVAPSSESTVWYRSLAEFSLADRGFFPYHPASVEISAEGWLYVGVQEGRIFRMRPRPVMDN